MIKFDGTVNHYLSNIIHFVLAYAYRNGSISDGANNFVTKVMNLREALAKAKTFDPTILKEISLFEIEEPTSEPEIDRIYYIDNPFCIFVGRFVSRMGDVYKFRSGLSDRTFKSKDTSFYSLVYGSQMPWENSLDKKNTKEAKVHPLSELDNF